MTSHKILSLKVGEHWHAFDLTTDTQSLVHTFFNVRQTCEELLTFFVAPGKRDAYPSSVGPGLAADELMRNFLSR